MRLISVDESPYSLKESSIMTKKESNVELLEAGQPQVAGTVEHKATSFADLLSQLGSVPAQSKKTNETVKACSDKEMRLIAPELTDGLVDGHGKCHPGTIHLVGDGENGTDKGALYVCRFVQFTPRHAQYLLKGFGEGNRDPIPARQKMIIQKQKDGEFNFVFNTIVMTVNEAGMVSPTAMEQHNAGHTCRGQIESGINYTYLLCLGVPVKHRDKIDDNAARSAKDIASTRSEIKEYFAIGTVIGGAVELNKVLSGKCKAALTESLRIVDDVRHGLAPKSGGSRDKTDVGQQLDYYGEGLAKAIGLVIAMDSRTPTTDAKTGKVKTNGALSKRIPYNHAVAALALAAMYKKEDGSLGWNDDVAADILQAYLILANETQTDQTQPMICLRNTIDRWNAAKRHNDSTGKNVRFAVLKMALLAQIDGEEIHDDKWLEDVPSQDVTDPSLKLGGIDDHVSTASKRMAAGSQPATSNEPLALIPEDGDEDEGGELDE